MRIPIIRRVLESNAQDAANLRQLFAASGVLVLNLISAPGAGKTSLLERTLCDLRGQYAMAVIEGDLQTDNDARRVAAAGAAAVQVNTEGGCHLSAAMVRAAVRELDVCSLDILFVENVGNLVCPVEFDLGEDHKVALSSVTEGDDKVEKYPLLFRHASCMLLNKVDLLPFVDFDISRARDCAMRVNPDLAFFALSCRQGRGLDAWYAWLAAQRACKAARS